LHGKIIAPKVAKAPNEDLTFKAFGLLPMGFSRRFYRLVVLRRDLNANDAKRAEFAKSVKIRVERFLILEKALDL
jgi:hypothetical protein